MIFSIPINGSASSYGQVTGGYSVVREYPSSQEGESAYSFSKSNNKLLLTVNGPENWNNNARVISTKNMIDFTNFTKTKIVGSIKTSNIGTYSSGTGSTNYRIFFSKTIGDTEIADAILIYNYSSTSSETINISGEYDISAVNGEYYLGFFARALIVSTAEFSISYIELIK